jgi:hypothetical protein
MVKEVQIKPIITILHELQTEGSSSEKNKRGALFQINLIVPKLDTSAHPYGKTH